MNNPQGATINDNAPRHRLRSVAGVLGLLVGSGLAFLLVLEVVLRLFDPQIAMVHPNGMWQLDPVRGARLTPSYSGRHWYPEFEIDVKISAQGLRDRAYGPKGADKVRIMTLGDSFTFGFGVEASESYPKQLERRLNEVTEGERYEVINAGFPGYSTVQELRYLEEDGLILSPDIVLVGFFGTNDFADNLLEPDRFALIEGFLYDRRSVDPEKIEDRSRWLPAIKAWLWARSHAYRFTADRYRRLFVFRDDSDQGTLALPSPDADSQTRRIDFPLVSQAMLGATTGYLGDIYRAAESHEARAVLVLIPGMNMLGTPTEAWTVTTDSLKAHADEHQVAVIDLAQAFGEAGTRKLTGSLWFSENRHWKAPGHKLAAQVIAEGLRRSGLLE